MSHHFLIEGFKILDPGERLESLKGKIWRRSWKSQKKNKKQSKQRRDYPKHSKKTSRAIPMNVLMINLDQKLNLQSNPNSHLNLPLYGNPIIFHTHIQFSIFLSGAD